MAENHIKVSLEYLFIQSPSIGNIYNTLWQLQTNKMLIAEGSNVIVKDGFLSFTLQNTKTIWIYS